MRAWGVSLTGSPPRSVALPPDFLKFRSEMESNLDNSGFERFKEEFCQFLESLSDGEAPQLTEDSDGDHVMTTEEAGLADTSASGRQKMMSDMKAEDATRNDVANRLLPLMLVNKSLNSVELMKCMLRLAPSVATEQDVRSKRDMVLIAAMTGRADKVNTLLAYGADARKVTYANILKKREEDCENAGCFLVHCNAAVAYAVVAHGGVQLMEKTPPMCETGLRKFAQALDAEVEPWNLAICMATHARLGLASAMMSLEPDTLEMIAGFAGIGETRADRSVAGKPMGPPCAWRSGVACTRACCS